MVNPVLDNHHIVNPVLGNHHIVNPVLEDQEWLLLVNPGLDQCPDNQVLEDLDSQVLEDLDSQVLEDLGSGQVMEDQWVPGSQVLEDQCPGSQVLEGQGWLQDRDNQGLGNPVE